MAFTSHTVTTTISSIAMSKSPRSRAAAHSSVEDSLSAPPIVGRKEDGAHANCLALGTEELSVKRAGAVTTADFTSL